MLVSVVIPAYNEEKYIDKTLAALKRQAHQGFDVEVIVADAESRDQTAKVAQSFGVRVLAAGRGSPATARQEGVKASRGELVVCIDADTLPAEASWLKTLVSPLLRDAAVVATTGAIATREGGLLDRFWFNVVVNLFYRINYSLGKTLLQGQSHAFRKRAFEKIGGFNTSLHTGEDFDLGLRLGRLGKVTLQPKALVYTSPRRVREGVGAILRGFFSYLEVVWGWGFIKVAKWPFPSVR